MKKKERASRSSLAIAVISRKSLSLVEDIIHAWVSVNGLFALIVLLVAKAVH